MNFYSFEKPKKVFSEDKNLDSKEVTGKELFKVCYDRSIIR